MFAALGVRVVLVEKRPRLLEFADQEIVEALCYHLRDHRVTLRLGEEVERVEDETDGRSSRRSRARRRFRATRCSTPSGRPGNVDALNLAAAGLEADARGRITVDAEYRTQQPHIFAVGDVIGFPSLASVSMEQGRLAAGHAVGTPVESNPASYPYGIYTIPEISLIGKTEEQLTDEDVPYEIGLAVLPRDRARADPRRHDGPPQADLPPGDGEIARRAHHR